MTRGRRDLDFGRLEGYEIFMRLAVKDGGAHGGVMPVGHEGTYI